MRIQYMTLDALVLAPRNPKGHDVPAIQASIARFGFIRPILLDDATGRVVAGHGRIEALRRWRDAGGAPPARVHVKGGAWMVPVIRGVAFANAAAAEGYLVADNQLSEIGGYHEIELATVLADLRSRQSLEGTGFSDGDVDELLTRLEQATTPFTPNTAPEHSQRLVTGEDMSRAQTHLAERFEVEEDHVDVTCPECGGAFALARKDVPAAATPD